MILIYEDYMLSSGSLFNLDSHFKSHGFDYFR